MTRPHRTYSDGGEARPVDGAVDVEKPVEGFYRMRLRSGGYMVGIRLWYGPPHDPVTGEVMDRSWRWQAQANGEDIDFDRVWPACARSPITEQDYRQHCARQRWARENAPDTAHANPRRRSNPLTDPIPV